MPEWDGAVAEPPRPPGDDEGEKEPADGDHESQADIIVRLALKRAQPFHIPDGTGYALINEARRRGIRALNIAMSGYPFPSNVNEPGATGFDYHLTKPIDCGRLCSLLKKATPVRATPQPTSKISQAA